MDLISHAEHFTADGVGLPLLDFTQLFSKFTLKILDVPESLNPWATSSPLIVWVYLHSNFRGKLQKGMHFETVRNGRSRLSKVVDFSTNRKRVCNFLLVINSNLVPINVVSEVLRVLRVLRVFLLIIATPLFHPNFGGVPLGLDCRCWSYEERRH